LRHHFAALNADGTAYLKIIKLKFAGDCGSGLLKTDDLINGRRYHCPRRGMLL
jgi:hypothetical protein